MAAPSYCYWVFDETCICPRLHGYVGITKQIPRRSRVHKRRFGAHVHFVVLFSGTWQECKLEEYKLRPEPDIGWNNSRGGYGSHGWNANARAKMSVSLRSVWARRTPEELAALGTMYGKLAKGNKSRKGQKASEKERARRSAALRGNKNGLGKATGRQFMPPEERARLSERMKGKRLRLGAKLSDETKAKIAAKASVRMIGNRIRRGMTLTDDAKAKISAALIGKRHSSESKQKISAALSGRKLSDETKEKLRTAANSRHLKKGVTNYGTACRGLN